MREIKQKTESFDSSEILLPLAVHLEERLTVSQAVPEPGQQSVTETHSLGFLSVADTAPSSGEQLSWYPSSGRMVKQRSVKFLVGGSNPGEVNMPPPPPAAAPKVYPARGSNQPLLVPHPAALPFDQQLYGSLHLPHCLEPSQRKLLTPPPSPTPPHPHPPLKKVISSSRGYRPQNQKIHWGMVLLGKIMILQGVGHQISCLGVCYANDPKKGGYTTPAPALDLTTSLRGDFVRTPPPPLAICPPPWRATVSRGGGGRGGETVTK